MSQKFDHPSHKVLITGTSGTGKTELFWQKVRKERAQWKWVYDHQGEWPGRFGVQSVLTPAALEDKATRKGWVVYDPVEGFPGRVAEGFDMFCEYVFLFSKGVGGRKLFCVDELQILTDNRTPPQALLTICETGRRYQIDVYAISQAPNRIHNAVRNQFTDVYTFRHSDEAAIKFLTDNGFDGDAVRNLGEHEYLHRNLRTGETVQGREKI